eukprot:scaffold2910_cov390-Prasinococcus_capsulatus_cf.AAC.29
MHIVRRGTAGALGSAGALRRNALAAVGARPVRPAQYYVQHRARVPQGPHGGYSSGCGVWRRRSWPLGRPLRTSDSHIGGDECSRGELTIAIVHLRWPVAYK